MSLPKTSRASFVPNKDDHLDLIAMIHRIIDVANRSHVTAVSWFGKREQIERTIKQGSRFVVYSNDSALLRESLEQSFTQLRKR